MACGCGTCATCRPAGIPGGVVRPEIGPMALAQRLQPTVDRLRARMTRFGLRPYQVFMVWTRWSGAERGEGAEHELARIEIVPRPKVDDLTRVSLSPFSAGILPVGSLSVSEVSGMLTADNLRGYAVPGQAYVDSCRVQPASPLGGTPVGEVGLSALQQARGDGTSELHVPEPYDFFYEVVEDRAGSTRAKFRLFSEPFRDAGKFQWKFVLERIAEDRGRDGRARMAPDDDR